MSKNNFARGDTVVFRTWEDMEAEFGIRSDGVIPCKFEFVRPMEDLCGREYVIRTVYEDGEVELEDFDHPFTISTDMLSYPDYDAKSMPEVSMDAFMDFLGQ